MKSFITVSVLIVFVGLALPLASGHFFPVFPPLISLCGDQSFLPSTNFARSFVTNSTNVSIVYDIPNVGLVFYPRNGPPSLFGVPGPVTRGFLWLSEVCVDPVSYAPLVSSINQDGHIAILLDPTGTDYQAAFGKVMAAMDLYGAQVEYWAIGGHGYAGAVAGRIARALNPKIKGLYILAGTVDEDTDLSKMYIEVSVIYGNNDTFFSPATILASKSRLPDHTWFQAIPGAGHSDFGFYNYGFNTAGNTVTQTDVYNILTAPSTTAVVPPGPSILRTVLGGLHLPKVMPEALVYAANSTFSRYVYVPGKYYAFVPFDAASNKVGLLYHVGAYCDPRAYFPSLRAVADKGFVVVIPIFPFHNVLTNINLAFTVVKDFPTVTRWVSSGHSLGTVAAGYVAFQNSTQFVGMVLHDSAPRTNISTYPGPVLVAYGAAPGAGASVPTTSFFYTSYIANNKVPKSTQWYPIEGGNHYQFGWYNEQAGVGPATISRQVQTQLIVDSTLLFLLRWYNLP